jgi:hypothetical protein
VPGYSNQSNPNVAVTNALTSIKIASHDTRAGGDCSSLFAAW